MGKRWGFFKISEQRLADQARAIKLNEWLSEVELEEIRREVSQGGVTVANSEEVENQEGIHGEVEKHSDTENDNDRMHETSSEEMSTEEVIADMEKGGCSIEEIQMPREILESVKKEEDPPPNLRNVERKRLKEKVKEVNKVLAFMETKDITQTNRLLLAAGQGKVVPGWKRRLNGQVAQLRKDISRLERIKSDELNNVLLQESLEERYNLKKKRLTMVLEELKHRVLAKSKKISRYKSRIEQYRENRMFQSNQKCIFEKLDNMETENTMTLI